MKSRMSLKNMIIAICALLFFSCVGVLIFAVNVISNIPSESILGKKLIAPSSHEKSFPNTIDPETAVLQNSLAAYWVWNKSEISLEDNLNQIKDLDKLSASRLLFRSDFDLPSLKTNDCPVVYCFQEQMHFSQIPSLLWKGLIGIEDYRFLKHKGVDPKSLARAVWHDLKVMRLEQGGSTLTQQLVKNLFYTNEKKFSRKIKEMIVSTYIEFKYEKEQILQAYFNEVMWGSIQGIKLKGVSAAAFGYFLKKPNNLHPFEASILISLLKGPYFYSPIFHPQRLRERAIIVFDKLKELSLFSDRAKPWGQDQWDQWVQGLKKRNVDTNLRSLYFLTQKEKDKQSFENYVLIEEMAKVLKGIREKYENKDIALKAVLYRADTNVIKREFSHYTKFERDEDIAIIEERHQVGSTLKPLIYGILSMSGLDLTEQVETKAVTLKLKSGDWTPREAHRDIEPSVTYKHALMKSLNRPLIRGVQKFGMENMEAQLDARLPRLQKPLAEYPAQLLGAVELSVDELAQVYGKFLQSACYEGKGHRALDVLTDPTNTTIRYRVGRKLGQMRFFGKTGTTNNGYDSWFVGHDGHQLLVVWTGLEGKRSGELNLYGSNSSFLVYKNFMQYRGKLFNEMVCRKPNSSLITPLAQ